MVSVHPSHRFNHTRALFVIHIGSYWDFYFNFDYNERRERLCQAWTVICATMTQHPAVVCLTTGCQTQENSCILISGGADMPTLAALATLEKSLFSEHLTEICTQKCISEKNIWLKCIKLCFGFLSRRDFMPLRNICSYIKTPIFMLEADKSPWNTNIMEDGAWLLCEFMIKQSDGTETDSNGSDVEVQLCKVTVVYEPLNLTWRGHVCSHQLTLLIGPQSVFVKVCNCNVWGSRQ